MLSEIIQLIKRNLFLIILTVLISLLSFQLGKISGPADEPIKIEQGSILEIQNSEIKSQNLSNPETESGGEVRLDFRVVVSKNSNKYHFLWCPGAKQIKEENKIYFNSEEGATAAGYVLAGNCSK